MKIKIYSSDGGSSTEKEFEGLPTFEGDKGLHAVRQTILAIQANKRQGTHQTKTRAMVAGGGKKPFRQKGTGRGRQGSTRAPHFRGGGTVFGPQPRDYTQKVNRKVKQLAFRRALFDRIGDGGLAGIERWDISAPKTRLMDALVGRIASRGSLLLVDDTFSDSAILSARNIQRVAMTEARDLNVYDLLRYDLIVVSEKGLERLQARLRGENASNDKEVAA